MGILINGMEMPKDKAVAVVIHPDGTAYTAEMVAGVCTEYLADCIAVTVPPHGRLIDADDFIKRMEGLVHRAEADGYDFGAAWYTAFIRHIELAPTVIEASE